MKEGVYIIQANPKQWLPLQGGRPRTSWHRSRGICLFVSEKVGIPIPDWTADKPTLPPPRLIPWWMGWCLYTGESNCSSIYSHSAHLF